MLFRSKNNIYRIKVSHKRFVLFWKQNHWLACFWSSIPSRNWGMLLPPVWNCIAGDDPLERSTFVYFLVLLLVLEDPPIALKESVADVLISRTRLHPPACSA